MWQGLPSAGSILLLLLPLLRLLLLLPLLLLLQLLQHRVQLVCCYGQLLVEDVLHLLQGRAGRPGRQARQAGQAGDHSKRSWGAGRVGDRMIWAMAQAGSAATLCCTTGSMQAREQARQAGRPGQASEQARQATHPHIHLQLLDALIALTQQLKHQRQAALQQAAAG